MKPIRNFSASLLALLLFFLQSCEKPDDHDLDLQPDSQVTTTTVVYASPMVSTVRVDSTRTDQLTADFLGWMNDPIFGEAKASVFAQYGIVSDDDRLPEGATVDSVVLTLILSNEVTFYGNQDYPLSLEVKEIADGKSFSETERLYAGTQISVQEPTLGSVTDFKFGERGTLSLTFSDDFAQRFTSLNDNYDEAAFTTDFPGLALIPSGAAPAVGEGAVRLFNFIDTTSQLTVYWTQGSTKKRSQLYFTSGDQRYSQVMRSSSTPIIDAAVSADSVSPVLSYCQAAEGTKVNVLFPQLQELASLGRVGIHKATLSIPVIDDATFPAPPKMNVFQSSESGTDLLIKDVVMAYFNRDYIPEDEKYSFLVSRHVQDLILRYQSEEKDYGFNISVPTDNPSSLGRAVLLNEKDGRGITLTVEYSLIGDL